MATAPRLQLVSALETLWRVRRDDEVVITDDGLRARVDDAR